MTISGAFATTLAKPAELQRTYQPAQSASAQTQKPSLVRRFDSVTISGENSRTFAMEARRTLANEIRAASASGPSPALTEAVRAGTYQPDGAGIARSLLLFGEGG